MAADRVDEDQLTDRPSTGMSIADLLAEYDRARDYTRTLYDDLTEEELVWRPSANSSAIGWHLGHQAAVTHFLVRNLMAAEPSIDPALDRLMDAATGEPDRGVLPPREQLVSYRDQVASRLHTRIGNIQSGDVGAPNQLRPVAQNLLIAVINHEYQHDQWIGEVRKDDIGKALPARPTADCLVTVDGYLMVDAA